MWWSFESCWSTSARFARRYSLLVLYCTCSLCLSLIEIASVALSSCCIACVPPIVCWSLRVHSQLSVSVRPPPVPAAVMNPSFTPLTSSAYVRVADAVLPSPEQSMEGKGIQARTRSRGVNLLTASTPTHAALLGGACGLGYPPCLCLSGCSPCGARTFLWLCVVATACALSHMQ